MPPRHCVQHLRRIRSPLHFLQLTVVLHTCQAALAAALGLGLHPALPLTELNGAELSSATAPRPGRLRLAPLAHGGYAHGTSCSRAKVPGAAVWPRGPAKAYSAACDAQAP